MRRIPKKHSAQVKFVREIMPLGVKEARKITGLPASLLERIAAGTVEKISHKTFNKFRNGYAKTVYNALIAHNVLPKEARSRKYGLTFKIVGEAIKQTDYGKPLELALNSLENHEADIKKIIREEDPQWVDEFIDEEEDEYSIENAMEKAEYRRQAKIICANNDFFTQWKAEGKKFFHSGQAVKTDEDCIQLMLQISAHLGRSVKDWDIYIKEQRQGKEAWKPYKYQTVKIEGKKHTLRLPLPDADPKYIDWQQRMKAGQIVRV